MKTRRYYILLSVLVCGGAIVSRAGEQPTTTTTERLQIQLFGASTLQGARPVYPQVIMTLTEKDANEPSSPSKIGPLIRQDLQSLVEQKLRDSKIKTADNYAEPTTAAAPLSLGVAVTITTGPKHADNDPLYAAFVSTEVHQPVTLLRDDSIRTLNRTWPIVHYQGLTQRLFILHTNNLKQTIETEVSRQVSLFINDYRAANTKTTQEETRYSGIPERFARESIWMICRNPACEAQYQITKKEYYEFIEKHRDPRSTQPPPLICKTCREHSVHEAVKCQKCGLAFETGTVPRDYTDRCPKCGHSKIEADRKDAARRRYKK